MAHQNMNKKDLILAKKVILARQTREESLEIKRTLATAGSSSRFLPGSSGVTAGGGIDGRTGTSLPRSRSLAGITENNRSSFELPSLDRDLISSNRSNNNNNDSGSSTHSPSSHSPHKHNNQPEVHLNETQSAIVNELSNRSVTSSTGMRKMKNEVAARVMGLEKTNPAKGNIVKVENNDSTMLSEKVFDKNYFMPAKTILRADGASLYDVYMSKRKDTWGSIIRSQYLEDEAKKKVDKQKKIEEDEKFGRLLHEQVLDIEYRKQLSSSNNDNFAVLEAATTRRRDEMNKQREQDSRDRYKQFIANAVTDCEIKRKRLQKEWTEDIEAAMQMIKMDNDACEKERQKIEHKKGEAKHLTEILFKENLESIERKRLEKIALAEEVKRINAIADEKFRREEQRKKDALDGMMTKATDGPAHKISEQIKMINKKKENDFYNKLMTTENGLSIQLKKTEDLANARLSMNGKGLSGDWDRNMAIKNKEKADLVVHNQKINAVMQQIVKDSLKKDDEDRHLKHLAKLDYQRQLDAQVKIVRTRSLQTLQATMSEQEKLMNSGMLAKSAQVLATYS